MERIDTVDLILLRSFLAVVQTGSISLAARSLGLSQPTVTQHVQRLEAQLEVALLLRKERPFGLTRPGEILAKELPDRIADLDNLLKRVCAAKDTPFEVLRIVMPDSLSCILGAEFLAAAGKLARTLELRSGISPWIEETLQARRCDLAIDCLPLAQDSGARCIPLFCDPYLVVRPRSLADLPLATLVSEHPQVAFGRNSKFGKATAAIATDMGATETSRFSFDSTQSLLRFVQVGYGWAVTSAFCLLQSPASLGKLDFCACPDNAQRVLCLLAHQEFPEDLHRRAAEHLIAVFHQLLDGPWSTLSHPLRTLVASANSDRV